MAIVQFLLSFYGRWTGNLSERSIYISRFFSYGNFQLNIQSGFTATKDHAAHMNAVRNGELDIVTEPE